MNKIVGKDRVKELLQDGMTIMIGGFMSCGAPEVLIDAVIESGVRNLTVIANDTGTVDRGIGRLVVNGSVKKVIASHIGTNPETGRMMTEGLLEVELIPQGTLIEKIRTAGAGLGGFLTPTGVGTIVETGKQKIEVDGVEYLLEKPINADLALLRSNITDETGNTFYKGTTKNFNVCMALAAETVIVEAEQIVKKGELDPELVMTPGVLVDYIVKGGELRGV